MGQPKTLEDKIADALRQHAKRGTSRTRDGNPWKDACYCGGWTYSMADHQANAVMALIRGMTRPAEPDSYYPPGFDKPDRVPDIEEVIFHALKHTDHWGKIQASRYIVTVLRHTNWLGSDQPRRGCGDDTCTLCNKLKEMYE